MPKRQREKRIECDKVQGEGSYVLVKSPEYGLIVEAMEMSADKDQDESLRQLAQQDLGERILADSIVEWNWVDDDDKPFPQYGEDGMNATKLTLDEVMFLLDHILGDSRRKN